MGEALEPLEHREALEQAARLGDTGRYRGDIGRHRET